MLTPGLRVVRGPNWSWQNQGIYFHSKYSFLNQLDMVPNLVDGGEGYTGTVCEIGKTGSSSSPDKTVVVQWDSGFRSNYRVGYQGVYDLLVFDNAQIGIVFFKSSMLI